MKVTVCFGDTKVIVPCGNGDVQVSQVMLNAVQRFKKATQKPIDLKIKKLKTERDGGILDPDDILRDVVEDKEVLIAILNDANDYDSLTKRQTQQHQHEVLITENDFHAGKYKF